MGGSVYAIAGGKGGVGKTTVTANVAVALAEMGYDVAAVDADLGMTNLGAFLGIEVETGIHAALAGQAGVEDVIVPGPAGVAVVPGREDLAATADADPANLNAVIDPLTERADVVLVDTGAGLSHENLVAYGRSDGIFLVTTADDVAVGDAGKTGELADRVDAPVIGTIVTRVDADTDLASLGTRLDRDVVAAVPEYEVYDAAEPRVREAPDSPAAAEYERLANTVAVCHQTDDFGSAAREASRAVTLPAGPEPEKDGDAPQGVIEQLLARIPLAR